MNVYADFDSYIYSAGFSAQSTVYYVCQKDEQMPEQYNQGSFQYKKDADEFIAGKPGLEVSKVVEVRPVSHAINALKLSLSYLKKELGENNRYELFLTDGASNFRLELATLQPYKGNRSEEDKPVHYDALRAYAIGVLGAHLIKGQEADDEVSIRATLSPNSIIVSIDKDLNQVPGWHYNPKKQQKYYVDQVEGIRSFYMQMLTGDTADNIPGLFKLTGVKATKEIKAGLEELGTPLQMWQYVKGVYDTAAKKDCSNELLEIGRLLWMRRSYNEMWEPPK